MNSAPAQVISCQFLEDNAVGDSVKGFSNVHADYMHRPFLICEAGHPVTEGDQAGQSGRAFHKPLLARAEPSLLCTHHAMALRMSCPVPFPSTEVWLWSDALPNLQVGVTFSNLWSPGTSLAN